VTDPTWCPGCHEDRLVTRLKMKDRTASICDVCCTQWVVEHHVERRTDDAKLRNERQTDVGGTVIDGP